MCTRCSCALQKTESLLQQASRADPYFQKDWNMYRAVSGELFLVNVTRGGEPLLSAMMVDRKGERLGRIIEEADSLSEIGSLSSKLLIEISTLLVSTLSGNTLLPGAARLASLGKPVLKANQELWEESIPVEIAYSQATSLVGGESRGLWWEWLDVEEPIQAVLFSSLLNPWNRYFVLLYPEEHELEHVWACYSLFPRDAQELKKSERSSLIEKLIRKEPSLVGSPAGRAFVQDLFVLETI